MPANLPITPPTLAANYCFESWQQTANDLIGGATVQLDNSGWTVILYQASAPTAAQRDYLWFRTGDDRIYKWESSVSAWVARHELPPSGTERRIWTGTTADLITYDGGDSSGTGDASGPMWEVDTTFQYRVPIGAGTLPTSGTVLAIGDTGGNEKVTLTTAQIPSHTHTYTGKGDTGAGGSGGGAWVGDGTDRLTSSTGDGEAHDNMQPYKVVYFIKRTARIYRKAT